MRLVSATATLYNTPSSLSRSLSLSLSLSRPFPPPPPPPRQLVSKKEAASLPSFIPSFLLGAKAALSPLEPASTRHSAVRSPVAAPLRYTRKPHRREGRDRRTGGRGGFATKQTRKQAKARYRRRRRPGRMVVAGVTTLQRQTPRPNTGEERTRERERRGHLHRARWSEGKEGEEAAGKEGGRGEQSPKKTLLTEAERGKSSQGRPPARPRRRRKAARREGTKAEG